MASGGWSTPFKSFDAAALTVTTTGAVLDLDDVFTDHAVWYTLDWSAGADASIIVQGSLDGSNWFTSFGTSIPFGGGSVGSLTTLQVITLKPARYLRAVTTVNVATATVTAEIVSRA